MPSFKFKLLWTDSDEMVQVELSASNDIITAQQDFYAYPDNIKEFAKFLQNFPRSINDEAKFESGSEEQGYYNYLLIRAFVYDMVGHSAFEIKMDNHEKAPEYALTHFHIKCEAAMINEIGRQLSSWIEDMSVPKKIE